ncbi:late control protein B [Lonsdalea britannica]|uniref:Late control protein B n=1 Tax=Lonsdalea britannica TaxID=1082704 RepID=A0AAD0SIS2_9GAMM|nr:ogr/Delta-like zinc finger family protein [Lonsdalea britannica]AXW88366.1 late control protein B [Lonsdalea britannica]OSN00676.1 late control protein B [Lonsdalea britannica]
MMKCPLCGCAAHTRSSQEITPQTKERYNQCTNINCGHTFITMETFIRSIAIPASVNTVPVHTKGGNQSTLNI